MYLSIHIYIHVSTFNATSWYADDHAIIVVGHGHIIISSAMPPDGVIPSTECSVCVCALPKCTENHFYEHCLPLGNFALSTETNAMPTKLVSN